MLCYKYKDYILESLRQRPKPGVLSSQILCLSRGDLLRWTEKTIKATMMWPGYIQFLSIQCSVVVFVYWSPDETKCKKHGLLHPKLQNLILGPVSFFV
jgi:hypothetical protein